jgi:hypothetical protein
MSQAALRPAQSYRLAGRSKGIVAFLKGRQNGD